MKDLLTEMQAKDVIQPSQSPWASPVVLVQKKDGSARFCIDYRKLNSVTQKDAHPIPRIGDTLDTLAGSQWFSTLDMVSGYWQVEVGVEDREKTAFCTPNGLFEFKVISMQKRVVPSFFCTNTTGDAQGLCDGCITSFACISVNRSCISCLLSVLTAVILIPTPLESSLLRYSHSSL